MNKYFSRVDFIGKYRVQRVQYLLIVGISTFSRDTKPRHVNLSYRVHRVITFRWYSAVLGIWTRWIR